MGRGARLLLMWASAGWVALTILRRISRGEVVVLSAHAAPVVRLVATLLVFLASCAEKLTPQGPASRGPAPHELQDMSPKPAAPEPVAALAFAFPAGLDDAALARVYTWTGKRNLWTLFAGETTPGAETSPMREPDPQIAAAVLELVAACERHVTRVRAGEAGTAAELTALLDAAEAFQLYDLWLAAHLWQHARALSPAPVNLYARLERHVRVCTALALAEAETGPIEFSAWRSKAGPPPGWTGLRVPAGLADAARSAFARADAGTWESESVLVVTVVRGEVSLVRRGGEQRLVAGTSLRLRRLDVVRAPAGASLRHERLGELTLPASTELGAWNVAEFLGPAARAEVRALVGRALAGEAAALVEVEALLPATHAEIRVAVAAKPEAPGAAGLRLVLANFDE